MTSETTLSIGLICLVIGCVITVLNFINSRKKDIKAESSVADRIKEDNIKINLKLDQICQNLTELRQSTKSISEDIRSMETRITIVEQSLKQAWHKLDELKGE